MLNTATPDAGGSFLFTNVVASVYTIHFTVSDAALQAPKDSIISVTAGQNLRLGVIYADPKPGYTSSKIDTLVGGYYNAVRLADLLSRAPYDSLIVIQGNIILFDAVNTPAFDSALNKITLVTGLLSFHGSLLQSISMRRLTGAGALGFMLTTTLAKAHFPVLKEVGPIEVWSTPLLSTISAPSLQTVGSLDIRNTAFANLDMFKNAIAKPGILTIQNNPALTNISGLHIASDSIYDITITYNHLLASLDGLQGIKKAVNKITISNNARLQTLEGLNTIVNADQLQILDNPQLTGICAAKPVINAVKDRLPYTIRELNAIGNWVTITIDPFIAANNGSYVTDTDLINAVAQCP